MKHLFFGLMISTAFIGFTSCKNNNPSGTPKPNDTTFINRNGNDSSGGAGSASPAGGSSTTDTSGQKKDSTSTKK